MKFTMTVQFIFSPGLHLLQSKSQPFWHVFKDNCFQHNQCCTCRWPGLWSLEAEFSVTWAVEPNKKHTKNPELDKKQPDLYKPVTLT